MTRGKVGTNLSVVVVVTASPCPIYQSCLARSTSRVVHSPAKQVSADLHTVERLCKEVKLHLAAQTRTGPKHLQIVSKGHPSAG